MSTGGRIHLPPEVAEANRHWQRQIESEIGDVVRADVVRLVGGGLFVEALTGDPPSAARIDALVAHLLGRSA